jgi:bisphosphoglycerate-dependent phosphoglycerate mutase
MCKIIPFPKNSKLSKKALTELINNLNNVVAAKNSIQHLKQEYLEVNSQLAKIAESDNPDPESIWRAAGALDFHTERLCREYERLVSYWKKIAANLNKGEKK